MDYDKILNKTVKDIKPSGIRKFFDIVVEMKNAISLGVGEPDFETPWIARDSAIKSLQKGKTQYTSNAGDLKLRELIRDYYKLRFNLEYNPKNEIIVTIGASEAIDLALRAIVNPQEEVLIPEPSYVSYSPCVSLTGGVPVPVKCYAKDEFSVTAENLEKVITPKTKAIILPYPNNPTGGIMGKKQLEEIAEVIKKYNIIVISDEIYSELTYNSEGHYSIGQIDGMRERSVLINGFSKSFAMTGWRLGYVLAPEEICYAMYKIHQYTIMCAPTPSQYAGIAIMQEELKNGFLNVSEMRNEYNIRRRYVYNRLKNMGFEVFEPKGAFYVFPCVKNFGFTGETFAEELLNSKKVAVVPGSAFGESGNDYVRISYAYSMQSLTKALDRIEEFINELKNK